MGNLNLKQITVQFIGFSVKDEFQMKDIDLIFLLNSTNKSNNQNDDKDIRHHEMYVIDQFDEAINADKW